MNEKELQAFLAKYAYENGMNLDFKINGKASSSQGEVFENVVYKDPSGGYNILIKREDNSGNASMEFVSLTDQGASIRDIDNSDPNFRFLRRGMMNGDVLTVNNGSSLAKASRMNRVGPSVEEYANAGGFDDFIDMETLQADMDKYGNAMEFIEKNNNSTDDERLDLINQYKDLPDDFFTSILPKTDSGRWNKLFKIRKDKAGLVNRGYSPLEVTKIQNELNKDGIKPTEITEDILKDYDQSLQLEREVQGYDFPVVEFEFDNTVPEPNQPIIPDNSRTQTNPQPKAPIPSPVIARPQDPTNPGNTRTDIPKNINTGPNDAVPMDKVLGDKSQNTGQPKDLLYRPNEDNSTIQNLPYTPDGQNQFDRIETLTGRPTVGPATGPIRPANRNYVDKNYQPTLEEYLQDPMQLGLTTPLSGINYSEEEGVGPFIPDPNAPDDETNFFDGGESSGPIPNSPTTEPEEISPEDIVTDDEPDEIDAIDIIDTPQTGPKTGPATSPTMDNWEAPYLTTPQSNPAEVRPTTPPDDLNTFLQDPINSGNRVPTPKDNLIGSAMNTRAAGDVDDYKIGPPDLGLKDPTIDAPVDIKIIGVKEDSKLGDGDATKYIFESKNKGIYTIDKDGKSSPYDGDLNKAKERYMEYGREAWIKDQPELNKGPEQHPVNAPADDYDPNAPSPTVTPDGNANPSQSQFRPPSASFYHDARNQYGTGITSSYGGARGNDYQYGILPRRFMRGRNNNNTNNQGYANDNAYYEQGQGARGDGRSDIIRRALAPNSGYNDPNPNAPNALTYGAHRLTSNVNKGANRLFMTDEDFERHYGEARRPGRERRQERRDAKDAEYEKLAGMEVEELIKQPESRLKRKALKEAVDRRYADQLAEAEEYDNVKYERSQRTADRRALQNEKKYANALQRRDDDVLGARNVELKYAHKRERFANRADAKRAARQGEGESRLVRDEFTKTRNTLNKRDRQARRAERRLTRAEDKANFAIDKFGSTTEMRDKADRDLQQTMDNYHQNRHENAPHTDKYDRSYMQDRSNNRLDHDPNYVQPRVNRTREDLYEVGNPEEFRYGGRYQSGGGLGSYNAEERLMEMTDTQGLGERLNRVKSGSLNTTFGDNARTSLKGTIFDNQQALVKNDMRNHVYQGQDTNVHIPKGSILGSGPDYKANYGSNTYRNTQAVNTTGDEYDPTKLHYYSHKMNHYANNIPLWHNASKYVFDKPLVEKSRYNKQDEASLAGLRNNMMTPNMENVNSQAKMTIDNIRRNSRNTGTMMANLQAANTNTANVRNQVADRALQANVSARANYLNALHGVGASRKAEDDRVVDRNLKHEITHDKFGKDAREAAEKSMLNKANMLAQERNDYLTMQNYVNNISNEYKMVMKDGIPHMVFTPKGSPVSKEIAMGSKYMPDEKIQTLNTYSILDDPAAKEETKLLYLNQLKDKDPAAYEMAMMRLDRIAGLSEEFRQAAKAGTTDLTGTSKNVGGTPATTKTDPKKKKGGKIKSGVKIDMSSKPTKRRNYLN